jgi:small subunit ribosomal protein S17
MKVKILNIIDNKTFKAVATSYKPHKKYGKYITSHKNYLVHCEESKVLVVGQEVSIVETKPISKRKRWVLNDVSS